ncbi:MAG TPA: N-acetylmuramoyl-L-alanine amidase [Kofleriaceae bacterium]|nr:N-acetylmuramoyl-L-alanine amidase [Kofleriaceae bacterium]
MQLGPLLVVAAALAAGAGAAEAAPLVVIDAGHGGSNTGATGAAGIFEKQLTLVLARAVRDDLTLRGYDVVLTRERDATLTLRQRVAAANRRRADLFVSIHANASPGRVQRGFETFVLTAAGVDVDGRALRSETGSPRPGIDAATALILDDVERGACQWEAADLAAAIQRELRAVRGEAGDRGVRQDAHHVLLGATMPAVLVEVGFIDHPIEGQELARPATQAAIARALAKAISGMLPVDAPP